MGVKGFGYIGECTKSVGEKPEARGFFVVVLREETNKGHRDLKNPWSFNASTPPTAAATNQALLAELIFDNQRAGNSLKWDLERLRYQEL
ncbi:hypothetical protein NC653_041810 [Populus alba x Populus x berolinensis]|uniref:Uncharacterized protein n=1 Tax=Populus alba x Populus x berolinensis TaxID=444605 RepID=A0AAD6L9G6_9ROSI|nr:hypothetical protein NC653_041810 [Populus alba x Populus x berolinensis]